MEIISSESTGALERPRENERKKRIRETRTMKPDDFYYETFLFYFKKRKDFLLFLALCFFLFNVFHGTIFPPFVHFAFQ
jgi:hypothetical protein